MVLAVVVTVVGGSGWWSVSVCGCCSIDLFGGPIVVVVVRVRVVVVDGGSDALDRLLGLVGACLLCYGYEDVR